MRIILTQAEIEQGIENLILEQVNVPDDMRIDIDLKATRGEEGYQAFVDIVAHDAPTDGTDRSVDDRVVPLEGAETLEIGAKVLEAKAKAANPIRRGRPVGSKNKPKTNEGTEAAEVAAALASEPVAETNVEAPVVNATDEVEVTQETPVEAAAEVEEDVEIRTTPETAGLETDQEMDEGTIEADLAQTTTASEDAPEGETVEETPQPEQPVPTPEPAQEPAEAPVEAAPTRSLFANLTRPQNS